MSRCSLVFTAGVAMPRSASTMAEPGVLPLEVVGEGLPLCARSIEHKSPTDSEPGVSSFLSPPPKSLTPGCH